MRHYEIVLILNPGHESQIENLLGHFKEIVESGNGIVHRFENLGVRHLAYKINGLKKANYGLMNIEVTPDILKKLEEQFYYNETVIRSLVLRLNGPITEPSILSKEKV